jgi:DNA-binding LacI/PurR family transcriptional regulator
MMWRSTCYAGSRARPRIFALTDSMAVGVLHAAAELGLRVPADLSIVGFDDIPLVSFPHSAANHDRTADYAMGESARGFCWNSSKATTPGRRPCCSKPA